MTTKQTFECGEMARYVAKGATVDAHGDKPCAKCGGTGRAKCPHNDTCGKGVQCQMAATEEANGICTIPCPDCKVM